jgi:hypothetical protein
LLPTVKACDDTALADAAAVWPSCTLTPLKSWENFDWKKLWVAPSSGRPPDLTAASTLAGPPPCALFSRSAVSPRWPPIPLRCSAALAPQPRQVAPAGVWLPQSHLRCSIACRGGTWRKGAAPPRALFIA